MKNFLVLIHPPVAKICEPPAGLAKLSGALTNHGIPHTLIDASQEGILHLLSTSNDRSSDKDPWTKRAYRHLDKNLALLKNIDGFKNIDRYRRAVNDVNRALQQSANKSDVIVNLANYQDPDLSPLRSRDILAAAEQPEINPFYPYFKNRLSEVIIDNDASHIGFSLNYLSQVICTFAMIGFIKKIAPHIRIILGGGLVTSWMRRPGWENPFHSIVDHMIAGPGEIPLVSYLGSSSSKNVAIPDYGGFILSDYLSPGVVLPFSTATGCYWRRCSFCPEKAEGNNYQPIPAAKALQYLRELITLTNPSLIHFLDNALSPSFLSAIQENPPGRPWYGFSRITDHLGDINFCKRLKDSGCVMLKLGVESGDQAVLDALDKGIRLDTVSQVLHNLKKTGIGTYVYLLFGTPAETDRGARRTLEFTVKHSNLIGFLNIAVFNLPAFCSEAENLDTGSFYEGDISLYSSFRHPAGWDRHLVRQFLDSEFRRHPHIASIIKRDPPFFTSNHAPFFLMAGESAV